MGFFDRIDEAIKAFKGKGDDPIPTEKQAKKTSGEGISAGALHAYGFQSAGSIVSFYNQFIASTHENEILKIREYRNMSQMPEIADVIEDACNEAIQPDDEMKTIKFTIKDEELSKNQNIVKNLTEAYDKLFYDILDINHVLWDYMYTYMIDGRIFYEIIINESKGSDGIIGIKKLPAETMDYVIDPHTNKIKYFFQYIGKRTMSNKIYETPEEAEKDKNIIVFYPAQIGFVNTGIYGKNKKDIIGYLDKARIPYNQLKLLETSVIIYRLVRSPERFVFKIDTGNMPIDKAMKFVNKVKESMSKKQTYDQQTGKLTNDPNVLCIRNNAKISLLDGRNLTLNEIISEFNEGKELWAYSINKETQQIEPDKIINAKITRKNEKLIRIYLDNNKFIDTTLDHKFIMLNGDECRADKLKVGEALMPLNKRLTLKIVKIDILNERDDCGCINVEGNHNFAVECGVFIKNSILENYYIPVNQDGRGSNIETIGGGSAGFTELDDIYYFSRKLYRALKYPMSRVSASHEKREGDIVFGGQSFGEISRDEIKWSRLLESINDKFCESLTDLFLLHLQFIGLKSEYGLNKSNIKCYIDPPNEYKAQMEQKVKETKFQNFSNLSNEDIISKVYLMKTELGWNDAQIEENFKSFQQEEKLKKKYLPKEEDDESFDKGRF